MVSRHLRRLVSVAPACALAFSVSAAQAQQVQTQQVKTQQVNGATTLFNNVRVFDGKGTTLSEPTNVLVRGNLIERLSRTPIAVDRSATTTIIEGGGRTLMPGLIDNHWHAMLIRPTPLESMGDVGYNNIAAGDEAADTLMRGFTTVRDVGGPVFGLKRVIDEGIVKDPARLQVRPGQ